MNRSWQTHLWKKLFGYENVKITKNNDQNSRVTKFNTKFGDFIQLPNSNYNFKIVDLTLMIYMPRSTPTHTVFPLINTPGVCNFQGRSLLETPKTQT